MHFANVSVNYSVCTVCCVFLAGELFVAFVICLGEAAVLSLHIMVLFLAILKSNNNA